MKADSGPPSTQRQAVTGSGSAAAASFMQDYMASNPRRSSSTSKDPWGLRGKGQKLGSA